MPTSCGARFGIEAGGQRAARSARRVHRQEPAVRRGVGRTTSRFAPGAVEEDVRAALGRARAAMFDARARRPRPHLDDKVLTAWNGLMIAAFARAARVLAGRPQAGRLPSRGAARRGLHPIDAVGRPRRVDCCAAIATATPAFDGYAEDYAFLIFGLLELFQADRRSGVAGVGDRRCRRCRTSCSGTRRRAAGSAPPATIRPSCCGSRRTTTAPNRRPSSVSVLNLLTLSHLVPVGRAAPQGRADAGAPRARASAPPRGPSR